MDEKAAKGTLFLILNSLLISVINQNIEKMFLDRKKMFSFAAF